MAVACVPFSCKQKVGSGRVLGTGCVVENFTLAELRAATDDYSDERRIRTGSSGSVFRGKLADGHDVAIRRVEEKKMPAFRSELAALSRANHKNVVRLFGFCDEPGEHALVYEFMSNGALHDQLHSRDGHFAPPLASWHGRLALALALHAARGIEYMHAYAVPPTAHRDVTSGNVLLDESWTAKIAGFGLSTPTQQTCSIDDERGDDVRSFGVVLLELMTVRGAESAVDFALITADERPSMTDVVDELQRAAARMRAGDASPAGH